MLNALRKYWFVVALLALVCGLAVGTYAGYRSAMAMAWIQAVEFDRQIGMEAFRLYKSGDTLNARQALAAHLRYLEAMAPPLTRGVLVSTLGWTQRDLRWTRCSPPVDLPWWKTGSPEQVRPSPYGGSRAGMPRKQSNVTSVAPRWSSSSNVWTRPPTRQTIQPTARNSVCRGAADGPERGVTSAPSVR